MELEAVIGLEIHVEMKTKSKMFSSAPNGFSRTPNSHVALFDTAFPGTMPSVNKQAVINAIRVASALHMRLDDTLWFDRKNYFYADLPKGYQITQQFRPLGKDGYVEFLDQDGTTKRIRIERLHLEEDTCKQLHLNDYSLLDYNRAGVPLLEIVSYPEIRNGYQASKYIDCIRKIVVYSLTSDGKMEEGSLRCDVNVSLKEKGSNHYGTKVEIKNLNSLKNVQIAIDFEISRQKSLIEEGKIIKQETRRFDEKTGSTILMRTKSEAADYKYFVEPNILPIHLDKKFVENAIDTCPELYDAKHARYLSYGLSNVDAEIILSDIALSSYFDKALNDPSLAKTIAKFIIVELNAYLNKKNLTIDQVKICPKQLEEIALLQKEGYSHQQCANILYYLCDNGGTIVEAKNALKIEMQTSDDTIILDLVNEVLEKNQQSILDYKAGKDKAIGFLIGQVMKNSKGKANPSTVARIMKEEINKR